MSDELTYNIIGAAMEVHRNLGNGFLEAIYQEALEKEFKLRNIPYVREHAIHVTYKGEVLSKYYIADFICYESVIIELKALNELTNSHEAQLLNYLKATGIKKGLLINFGSTSLQTKRRVL